MPVPTQSAGAGFGNASTPGAERRRARRHRGGGLEAYAGIESVIEALHPMDPDAVVRRATQLNPEAGHHPVPQDPRELQAVRAAGERTLQDFPYFIWRYAERGRRFTDSDGGWLVTLVEYPQARIDRQVAWLGQVLATRGMPRVLLRRHLERLYEALRLRMPEPQAPYHRLLAAADALAAAQRAVIGDADVDRLAAGFEGAIAAEWRDRLPGTAQIIIGALADEQSGLAGTRDSVLSWFSDAGRFPADYIAAVRGLVEEARACIAASPG
jgi:hypothetical protein